MIKAEMLPFNGILFVAQLVLIIGLALLVGVVVWDGGASSVRRVRHLAPLLESERDRAAELGLRVEVWIGLRLVAGALGLLVGMMIGTPVVIGGGFAIGFFALPWFLGDLSAKRRLNMERALLMAVRTLVELITASNQTIDQALTDLSVNPDPILAGVLRPLGNTNESIRDRLIKVADRARSQIANRLCLDLLISLDTTPAAFVEEATEVLIPQLEEDLRVQERNYAVVAGGRTSALIVSLLMFVMFLVVMHVGSLRQPYTTFPGQIVLLVIGGMAAGVIHLIDRFTPRSQWVKWDLEAMKAQMESRF